MDTQLKKLENPMLRGYLVSKAHKTKIPTAMSMFSGMTFSMAIIFTKNLLQINFQDGDHKPEVLSVLHITFTAFACIDDLRFSMVVVLFRRHLEM